MKQRHFLLTALQLCALVRFVHAVDVDDDRPSKAAQKVKTAMRQVLKMIQQLEVEVSKEAATEAVNFQNFLKWCKAETQSGTNFIESVDSNNRMASGANAGASARLQSAEKTVARLAPIIAGKEGELRAAEKVRVSARALETAARQTLAKTIRAVDNAERYAKRGRRSFLQKGDAPLSENAMVSMAAEKTTTATTALNQEGEGKNRESDEDQEEDEEEDQDEDEDDDEDEDEGEVSLLQEDAVNTQERGPRRSGAVKAFDSMGDQSKREYARLQRVHGQNEAAWKRLEGAMRSEAKTLTKEMDLAKAEINDQRKIQTLAVRAVHQQEVMKLKKKAAMQDVEYQCNKRADEWKCRSKARADEINALKEAEKTINAAFFSDLAQLDAWSLLQIGSRRERHIQTRRLEAAIQPLSLLQWDAGSSNAGLIMALQRAVARGSPMGKVKDMVKQMLTKLLTEAAQEKEQHKWCRTTMAKTKADHKSSLRSHTKLSHRVSAAQVELAQTAKQVKVLGGNLEDLEKKAKQATDARGKDHKEFKESAAESTKAELAIKQAMRVMGDYQAERDNQARLLQLGQGDPVGVSPQKSPPTFADLLQIGQGDPVSGRGGSARGSVVVLLQLGADHASDQGAADVADAASENLALGADQSSDQDTLAEADAASEAWSMGADQAADQTPPATSDAGSQSDLVRGASQGSPSLNQGGSIGLLELGRGSDQTSGQGLDGAGADVAAVMGWGGKASPKPFAGAKERAASRGVASKMILDIMAMSLADFQKQVAQDEQAEQNAQREFKRYIQDYKVEKATISTAFKNLLADQNSQKKQLAEIAQDTQEAKERLGEVTQYLTGLKKKCGPKTVTFEDQMQRREKQIKSLQDAMQVFTPR